MAFLGAPSHSCLPRVGGPGCCHTWLLCPAICLQLKVAFKLRGKLQSAWVSGSWDRTGRGELKLSWELPGRGPGRVPPAPPISVRRMNQKCWLFGTSPVRLPELSAATHFACGREGSAPQAPGTRWGSLRPCPPALYSGPHAAGSLGLVGTVLEVALW